jgi:hypothetical protein
MDDMLGLVKHAIAEYVRCEKTDKQATWYVLDRTAMVWRTGSSEVYDVIDEIVVRPMKSMPQLDRKEVKIATRTMSSKKFIDILMVSAPHSH